MISATDLKDIPPLWEETITPKWLSTKLDKAIRFTLSINPASLASFDFWLDETFGSSVRFGTNSVFFSVKIQLNLPTMKKEDAMRLVSRFWRKPWSEPTEDLMALAKHNDEQIEFIAGIGLALPKFSGWFPY